MGAREEADEREITLSVQVVKRTMFAPKGTVLEAKKTFGEAEIMAEDGEEKSFTLDWADPKAKTKGSFTFVLRQHDNTNNERVKSLLKQASEISGAAPARYCGC